MFHVSVGVVKVLNTFKIAVIAVTVFLMAGIVNIVYIGELVAVVLICKRINKIIR